MANTVNDVMNVIASPDYGIKNIAGTNQEILAILSGTHNSPNNIHVIANDIKSLLQSLVDVSTEKKPIDIENKPTKINHKNIQDILDETRCIRKSITDLTKAFANQGKNNMSGVVKLDSKSSDKVADAMIKNINKQSKDGGLSGIADVFNKLKDISLKDIIFGNLKIKRISKLFKNAEKELKIKDEDLKSIIKLINATPEIVKALSKVSIRVNYIIKSNIIEKISNILIGKKSLLSLSLLLKKHNKDFEKGATAAKHTSVLIGNLLITSIYLTIAFGTAGPAIIGAKLLHLMVKAIIPVVKLLSKNNKQINKSDKPALKIAAFTGIMLVTTFMLAAIATRGIEALLGAVVLYGVAFICSKIFKLLDDTKKEILIGAISMAIMAGSLILFGIALQKICDATKDVSWKQVGIIATLTVMFGGVLAILGLLAETGIMVLGAATMLLMGVSLIPFGIALQKINDASKDVTFAQMAMVAGVIVILGLALATVGALSILIVPGAIALAAMSVGLILFSVALNLLSNSVNSIDLSDIEDVASMIYAVCGAFVVVGLLSILITPGAAALAIMSVSLILFSVALNLLSNSVNSIDISDMESIASMIKSVCGAFVVVGLFSVLIIPGAAALAAMGVGLILFSVALNLISDCVNNIDLLEMGVVALSIVLLGAAVAAVGLFSPFITPGAISLAVMGVSLILFSVALNKISKSVKDVNLSQMGDIALYMVIFGAAVTVVGLLSVPILLGTLTLSIMSNTLTKFSKTLETISKVGQEIKFSDITFFCLAMGEMSAAISLIAASYPFVTLGAKTIKAMNNVLTPFINILATINKIKNPSNEIKKITTGLNILKDFFKKNILESKVVDNAKLYKDLLKPFGETVKHFSKLKEVGEIPISLVRSTLMAMKLVSYYYMLNPIKKEAIKQAKRYKDVLNPFGETVSHFSKLKEIGNIPTSLVISTLDAMKLVSSYYINNPIEKEAIKQAKRYKNVLTPFGETLKYFGELNQMGNIPTSLVISTLDAMKLVSSYYINNPIEKEAIKQAKRYKNVLTPFGKTLEYFFKLKEIENIPIDVVINSLDAMKLISSHYINNPIEKEVITYAKRYKSVLEHMSSTIHILSNVNTDQFASFNNTLSDTLFSVNSVDLGHVFAVTNMFDTFNRINRSKNIINKFTDSVKDFTETCETLIDVMNNNTDAINNLGRFDMNSPFINTNENYYEMGSDNNTVNSKYNGIRIINVDEIAKTIAEKINGALSIEVPDSQVQLLINGTGGNEWTITRY